VKFLWTFTSQEKLDKFLEILKNHGLAYEVEPKSAKELKVSVEDGDYVKAKRALLKHKERRTSADSL
jgi:hypothetical protein